MVNMEENKECNTCKNIKNINYFYTSFSSCKECCSIQGKNNRDKKKLSDKILPINGLKICCTCNLEKSIDEFSKKSDQFDGLMRRCKSCVAKHHQKVKPDITKTMKIYYENNKTEINTYKNNWLKNKLDNDDLYKFISIIRSRVKSGLIRKNLSKNLKSTEDILGCTFEEFRLHIEKQFLYWMNWNNRGNICGTELIYNCSWDLDHIIPTSTAKTEEEVCILNHWSNFQPLCSKVNRDIKRANVYPYTNLELRITFGENKLKYI